MKKVLYILTLLLVFTSCVKDDNPPRPLERVEEVPVYVNPEIGYGTYVLTSGEVFVSNLDTDEKVKYDHFGPGKTTSSLRHNGSFFDIENLEQNVTTWTFNPPTQVPGYGEFVLNGDTVNPYGFYVTNDSQRIVEHPLTGANDDITQKLGGSARPIEVFLESNEEKTVTIRVHYGTGNIGGWNVIYVSHLIFKKVD